MLFLACHCWIKFQHANETALNAGHSRFPTRLYIITSSCDGFFEFEIVGAFKVKSVFI